MSSHELKKFVVDGNANSHDRRLTILRNLTWNLPNQKISKTLCKKTEVFMNHAEIAFQKQIQMYDAFEEDAKEYDEQNKEMDKLINQKRADLIALQQKWREINAERINKEKREALAQIITQLPSREESQGIINEIRVQEKDLEEREIILNEKLEARKELLYPLGLNLAMVCAEFKEDLEARQKRLLETKAQKGTKNDEKKNSRSDTPEPETASQKS
uniref:THO complex subunit 7 n=1 Tax=Panagrolaimus davidi TaxID=227884 RepID=A0A914PW38_9BILA